MFNFMINRNLKPIEDYVIIEKKTMELEDLLANSQRQVRLLEESEQRRKQQLENLILINNRVTLDNAALKKEIEQFRQQREDILNDMEELKRFHR
jgi:chromosome segregation ATPase